ncbi:MAG: SDR family NAD(P)-dependent oxidoreductase [Leptolyngbyaceae bacterium]|nr:SDR family NAD(P)-dependent oxidoreductase [Leptolyngbyaceae bacterium]
MTGRLDGKVALITGAATGMGEAIAHKFAMEGAKVLVSGLPDDPIDDVAQSIQQHGSEAVAFKGDVSQTEEAQACVQAAIDAFGSLDVLVNNAGVLLARRVAIHSLL